MPYIQVNIEKQAVTINNKTYNFYEAGLTTNADPVQPLTDDIEIMEVLKDQYNNDCYIEFAGTI